MTLIASFLAGSLLSLLLPVFLLLALVAWYLMFLKRVPEPTRSNEPPSTPVTPNLDAGGGPELSHTPLDG